ncbi:hypothetical protein BOTBODRAFT_186184 [Botryobasidium botryosum FD-172 SS1]|uniref:Pali-domain-containing protein n=1 Tax=Botryobasidium botryosum (strain FD-172 SS1) TaxID=930990 RepID=A0A067MN76_BOTB1|nr:hypothetical protein BOTBODRAFT_186184 [Botryobasidium botryosum FD-172 SS1]
MSRLICVPSVVLLFVAFILLLLVSISTPFLRPLDITRVKFNTPVSVEGISTTQLRLGIWAWCTEQGGGFACGPTARSYSVNVANQQTISHTWTRALIVHPIAAAITLIAFALSFSQHLLVMLLASLTAFLAALMTLVAFCIDIALYARVHQVMHRLTGVTENTDTAPGFWLTLVSFILLLIAGCTVCFGRRRQLRATQPATPVSSGLLARDPETAQVSGFQPATAPPPVTGARPWYKRGFRRNY